MAVLGQLDHRHVVHFLGLCLGPEGSNVQCEVAPYDVFIVQELCEGNLRTFVAGLKIALCDVVRINVFRFLTSCVCEPRLLKSGLPMAEAERMAEEVAAGMLFVDSTTCRFQVWVHQRVVSNLVQLAFFLC